MKKIVVISVLVIISILFATQIRRGALAGIILIDILREPEQALMGKIIAAPVKQEIAVSSQGRKITADLYVPRRKGPLVPLLLAHDAGSAGRSDERIAVIAADLARAGFLVMVPDLSELRSFRVRLSDAEDLIQSFRVLLRHDRVRPGGAVLGIGFGSGPLLLAAADPRMSGQVSTVAAFGGYGDLRAVLQFGLTGAYDYGGQSGHVRPDRTIRWTLAFRNIDQLASGGDREIMTSIVEKHFRLEGREAARLSRGLSPGGSAVYQFLRNTDLERFAPLYENLPTPIRESVRLLSPVSAVKAMKAEFILVHAMDDHAVPYTESLRLADAVGEPIRVQVALLPDFLQGSESDAAGLFRRYGVGGVRFYGALYRLLERARV